MIFKNTCQNIVSLWKNTVLISLELLRTLGLIIGFLLQFLILGTISTFLACIGTVIILGIGIPAEIYRVIWNLFRRPQKQTKYQEDQAIKNLERLMKYIILRQLIIANAGRVGRKKSDIFLDN